VDVTWRSAIRQVVDRFLATFPGRRLSIVAVICEGDRVCFEYDFAATRPGGIPGWPGAGELSVSHLCAVYTSATG
jgi:predicted ester cyclase